MNTKQDLQPGDVVSVRFAGVLQHYGVVTFGGRILTNSGEYGGVISQTYDQFAKGRPVKRHPSKNTKDAYMAESYSGRYLGRDYSLTGSNCIDFVRGTRRKKPGPVQLAHGVAMTLSDMFRR